MEESGFREYEFVAYLSRLMQAHPAFAHVAAEPLISRGPDRARPDFIALHNGRPIIVEVKRAAPLVSRRVNEYAAQLHKYGRYIQDAKLILVVPDELQDKYKRQLAHQQIEVWDLGILANMFYEQLPQIEGTPLFTILSRVQSRNVRTPEDEWVERIRSVPKGKSEWPLY